MVQSHPGGGRHGHTHVCLVQVETFPVANRWCQVEPGKVVTPPGTLERKSPPCPAGPMLVTESGPAIGGDRAIEGPFLLLVKTLVRFRLSSTVALQR